MDTLQPAYVLHVRPYRETSGLIDFITRDHGRIRLVAKGYRGKSSRNRFSLQPFRSLEIDWRGKGDLKTLVVAEETGHPLKLGQLSLIAGLYINELLINLLHQNDPAEELFVLYVSTLEQLMETDNIEPVLRFFERDLLDLLGYGLQLTVNNEAIVEDDAIYCYLVEQGPLPTKIAGQGVEVSGEALRSLSQGKFTSVRALKESKALMRYVLSYYLNGKELKTRELFRQF
jgi:DNA repair protein RecO (recombination protein O)